ncbi:sulfotransferase family cytosolic 1B member 1-like isoform X1 [Homarus americanus]|uniref:sulfotransferase family cytosolic 1B member 1-like isoform X1 n=1 Tax=Homarus americanus TaxID=6706 RepID=UPI001C44ED0D|nr:sulfotransferase family cytosolic 1B member 1-like isoform X1 [Homarus americanus]
MAATPPAKANEGTVTDEVTVAEGANDRSNTPNIIRPLDERDQQDLMTKFRGFQTGLIRVGEIGHLIPFHQTAYLKEYFNFRFREEDVLVMTFPRSGTTWTQEIVWLMKHRVDVDAAQATRLDDRVPFLEFDALQPPDVVEGGKDGGVFLEMAKNLDNPRTIKTHLPFSLLHPGILNTCKVVYVARNPKDVCVSYYHQQRLVTLAEFLGTFPEYVDFWCRDLLLQAPYWGHIAEGWARRHHRNVLFLLYENMKKDLLSELRRLNTFLETGLTEEELQKIAKFTSFESMKNRTSTNPMVEAQEAGRFKKGEKDFVRKGTTGDWINHFTPDLEDKFNIWLAKGGHLAKEIPFTYHSGNPQSQGPLV